MITFFNIRRYDNVPFEEYLKVPGYSHSFLKSEIMGITPVFNETEKVTLGKLVDGILMDPTHVNMHHPLYKVANIIALSIIKSPLGSAIKFLQTQLSYTAEMEYEGLIMTGKFRPDWILPGIAVIDLKVTFEKDVHALINYMGYENQLWGYAHAAGVQDRYILAQRAKKLSDGRIIPFGDAELIKLKPLTNENEFWESKILKFGRVAA